MNHTKTPWEFVPARKEGRMSCEAFIRAPKEGDMPYALEVAGRDYTGYGEEERRVADLQFIVKSANAHDELLAMLHEIVWQNCCGDPMTLWDYDEAKKILDRFGLFDADGFLMQPGEVQP